MIPELIQNTSLWQSVKEVLALLMGVLMMVLIALYE
jgi:zinc transporter 7